MAVANEVTSGAEVTLCSASPEMVLRPFADISDIKVIGTQLEVKEGILTGRISGHNCRAVAENYPAGKKYGPLKDYHLRAWGDTRGDYELLSAATDPHWRHFHSTWRRGKVPFELTIR